MGDDAVPERMLTLDAQVVQEPDVAATVDRLIDSPPMGAPDVYAMLALAARETSRLRLGIGATNPVTRHASVTANAMLTIHRLSGGRAVLGIGLGYTAVQAVGLPPARLDALRDYIGTLRRTFDEHGAGIPVYVAATGPRAPALAGEVGDGALVSTGTHPALVANALGQVWRGARAAGRDAATIDVVFQVGLAVSDDAGVARREASPMAARKALDVLRYPDTFLPPELEALRADSLRVARAYDIHRHTDPEASAERPAPSTSCSALTQSAPMPVTRQAARRVGSQRSDAARARTISPVR